MKKLQMTGAKDPLSFALDAVEQQRGDGMKTVTVDLSCGGEGLEYGARVHQKQIHHKWVNRFSTMAH